jgi:hypothetical protein
LTEGYSQKELPGKMENQHVASPSQQCFSTMVGFGEEFRNKEQYDVTGASPILF